MLAPIRKLYSLIADAKKAKHPLRYFFARIIVKNERLSRNIIINRNSYLIRLSQSNIAVNFFGNGQKERLEEENIIRQILRSGDTYVDVGANIGTLSLFSKSLVGSLGRVYAIEANKTTFFRLKDNIELNNADIKIYNFIVSSDSNNQAYITNMSADDCNYVVEDDSSAQNSQAIKTITLDKLLEKESSIRLLKIDIEGYEYEALLGAQDTLKKVKNIYLEHHTDMARNGMEDTLGIYAMLKRYDFQIFPIDLLNKVDYRRTNEVEKSQFGRLNCDYLITVKNN